MKARWPAGLITRRLIKSELSSFGDEVNQLQVVGEPVGEVKRRTIVSERANEVVGAGAVSSEERERGKRRTCEQAFT